MLWFLIYPKPDCTVGEAARARGNHGHSWGIQARPGALFWLGIRVLVDSDWGWVGRWVRGLHWLGPRLLEVSIWLQGFTLESVFWPPRQAGQPLRNLRNNANFRHPLYYWRKQKIMPITQLAPDPCPDPCQGQGSGANCVIDKFWIIYIIIHITQGVCVIIQGVSIICINNVIDVNCVIIR